MTICSAADLAEAVLPLVRRLVLAGTQIHTNASPHPQRSYDTQDMKHACNSCLTEAPVSSVIQKATTATTHIVTLCKHPLVTQGPKWSKPLVRSPELVGNQATELMVLSRSNCLDRQDQFGRFGLPVQSGSAELNTIGASAKKRHVEEPPACQTRVKISYWDGGE